MIPTPIGVVMILVGLWLMFRPVPETLAFVLWGGLFSGASAIDAPVLGHSSIPPALLALVILAARLLKSDRQRFGLWLRAASANAWFLVFCVYCALTSEILPRIFADRMNVLPMAQATAGYVKLAPSSQNLTQALYLLTTGFAALASTAISQREASARVFLRAIIWMSWVQVVTGLLDLVLSSAGFSGAFSIFRNGAYAQLSQEVGALHRISGLEPEPSAYAAISFGLFVVMAEAWLRNVRPRVTGWAALALAAMMVLSTSSTAFASLAVYVAAIVARAVALPGSVSFPKAARLTAIAFVLVLLVLGLDAVKPSTFSQLADLLGDLTIKKSSSESGLIRGLAAKQGWDALKVTRGLGVGVGSFRSSGLVPAIAGSVGVAGLLVFGGYCLAVLSVRTRSTFYVASTLQPNMAAMAAWGSLLSLIPALFSASGADPGPLFGVYAGLAIGWRMWPGAVTTVVKERAALVGPMAVSS